MSPVGRLGPVGSRAQAQPTGGSGKARPQSALPAPQMRKYVHCETARAPAIEDVSADRKYVCRKGVTRVVPESTTKRSRTMEPARSTSANGAKAASRLEGGRVSES
ncbi:hypothetical protein ONZ43_g2173 [Nemania bipapillata]|uniref:Uncharacterized protein n=1 Tax=Nemania bipapillata TaxID=110536 RepID=A0ACC2J1K4_9PEZI|nr:hypothetical protein ONZ43_g2173 [Nemania bipapillata]